MQPRNDEGAAKPEETKVAEEREPIRSYDHTAVKYNQDTLVDHYQRKRTKNSNKDSF